MAKNNIYNLKNDIIFKAFFGRKGKEEYLTQFLEALLDIKIESIKIEEEVNIEQLRTDEKGGRLDLQAKLDKGIIVNIEMQRKDWGNIQIRTIFYAAKIISRGVVIGTDYEDIQKTILVNILDYNMFPEYDDYISKTAIVLDKHRECIVTDNIEWWYIELPKFRKKCPDMNQKVNQWLAFIDDENEEWIKMAENKNKTLKKARKDMEYLTGDAEVRRKAEIRQKWDMEYAASMKYAQEQGEKDGLRIGKKVGIEEGKKVGIEEGKKVGIEEGKKVGIEEGKKVGIEEGKKVGIEEGKKIGIEEGKKIGEESGKKEEREKIAKSLLKMGLNIEQIIEATKLSKDEIESLR